MQLASGLASFFIFCPLERLSTIPADHIDLTRRPDDGAATGAYMLDTAVLGFFAPALCRAFHWLAASVDFILAQGFSDPGICLGCRCCDICRASQCGGPGPGAALFTLLSALHYNTFPQLRRP